MCKLPEECGDVCESCLRVEGSPYVNGSRNDLMRKHPSYREASFDEVSFRAGYDEAVLDDEAELAEVRRIVFRFIAEMSDLLARP